ncbi:MAG: hypothetical protein UW79_C0022G0027 [Candidatus Yanofskybacteria bacterium GW2011_GWA2_44_9]|uniref:PD-(D/E)XK endonuclease-like domain-containing protein n=1 Tax=Candidatus Yanofskybacteria bacterium GW2011_GWA2_44_9 TaxID=1619025 RepID=A0A0G1MKG5_9BACT|nr:MAG: hypothetical protein UW79_C0022G0027 [Candidatus Yanofskybacteria bacterium GW2011_GWA2_44_9]
MFLECPRCFWLDVRHKIKRPPGYPFTLSIAVDYLVKKEFDVYREKGQLPPVLKKFGIKDAVLYNGEHLSEWRNNFKGVAYWNEELNAILYGAVDDVLEFSDGSLGVIDYKSSGAREITIYDDYQKQMDVYNYILNQKGFQTYPEAFFVFYKVIKEGESGFYNALKFTEEVRPVKVNSGWVESVFEQAVATARSETSPGPGTGGKNGHCDHCHFVEMAMTHKINPDSNE